MSRRFIALLYAPLALAVALSACATLDGRARAAASTTACVHAAVAQAITDHERDDKRAHCAGAAAIAQRCSLGEAMVASYAKEFGDILGRGDASLDDLRAGHAGIACARTLAEPEALASCCEARGF